MSSENTDIAPHWKEVMDISTDRANVDPLAITRPHSSLLTYYVILSAATLFAFPFVFLPLFIRYKTLRYRFDNEGVAMSWGLLWETRRS